MSEPQAQGNLATLINDIFKVNTDFINTLSSTIGTLADLAGGIGAVIAFVNTITNLLAPGSPGQVTRSG